MKKTLLIAAIALSAMSVSAQQAITAPGFWDNWSIGVDGGVTTPLTHHAFFGSMRGQFGAHVEKAVTPAFGIGVEGAFGVNTSSWKGYQHSSTAIDNSYVGVYGAVDLVTLFGGYNCTNRCFGLEAVAGAGWGHNYINRAGQEANREDWNYFATKAGLNFNFNVSKAVTISLKPSVVWNMSDAGTRFFLPNGTPMQNVGVAQTSAAYDANKATFNLMAGLTYHFGNGFECVVPFDQSQIDALNGQINDLRAQLDACAANNAALRAQADALAAELAACKNRKPEVVKEVSNNLNSVRYVFFKIGSSVITADQMPNVEMIAQYMKNHPNSKVVIKGYASSDGPLDVNIKLAEARAQSVKNSLVNKYKVAANRIVAEGQGIGEMFTEQSWNRVSICTLEEK